MIFIDLVNNTRNLKKHISIEKRTKRDLHTEARNVK